MLYLINLKGKKVEESLQLICMKPFGREFGGGSV